ncbi:hypothetical protein DCE79_08930 [Lysinibacillus sp. 2017]|uniref:hypothetical protein n=1 Tax=unclassified Lysinibacillus TaxID=2636778 RepID=UPI000D529E25|nr:MULTISPECIES: hypothetical protein [unclassified Lysinibacillus]AWE07491.1 hypothetical protein DCE79_08930 [Lysinibacillus sp. 2017]TGN36654.1 hypothetical protein E4L99_03635 [Lysinibacillus sp. S2017]
MKIYSLSGASGTGKSTSALELAYLHNIEGIIDDGILIIHGEKCAGTSAKFEKNAFTAVRRAIFLEDAHRNEVKSAIEQSNIHSLLIIGTSDKMTKKIAARLDVGTIDTFIYVEDVRTQKEIRQAQFIRQTQGKHVMPIPHAQVEQNFFKRIIQKGRDIFLNKKKIGETTIVQPDFHKERIEIARAVYVAVLHQILSESDIVAKFEIMHLATEAIPQMQIAVYLHAPISYDVIMHLTLLQKEISHQFLLHFGIEPEFIHLQVRGIK